MCALGLGSVAPYRYNATNEQIQLAAVHHTQLNWSEPHGAPSCSKCCEVKLKALNVVATCQSHQSEGSRDTYFLSHLVRNVLEGCDGSWA